jgi:hypothetical protein
MFNQPTGPNSSITMAPVKPDGTFALNNVAPGEYVVRWGGPDFNERAAMPLTIGGSNLDGVALVSVKVSTIAGHIVIDRAANATIKPSEVRLGVSAVRPEDAMVMPGAGPAQIKDDFTFQQKAFPGRLLILGGAAIPGWVLKAVRLDGVDVTDSGFDLGTDPIGGVEVELTNVVSELSEIVSDANGSATRNAWVVVFTQDREKWRTTNRHVFPVRPDLTNQYRVRALRPGAYYATAVAVDAIEAGEWDDPDVLDRLRERAIAFEIGAAEKKTLNLALTPLDR